MFFLAITLEQCGRHGSGVCVARSAQWPVPPCPMCHVPHSALAAPRTGSPQPAPGARGRRRSVVPGSKLQKSVSMARVLYNSWAWQAKRPGSHHTINFNTHRSNTVPHT